MILLSTITEDGPRLAAKLASRILILKEACSKLGDKQPFPETLDLALSTPGGLDDVKQYVASLEGRLDELKDLLVPEEEVKIGIPFHPRSLICVGGNYKSHLDEGWTEIPESPVLFAKLQGSAIGPGEPIVIPPLCTQPDYEAELAVVIGRRASNVSRSEALHYVAGYTCLNDISGRDFQLKDGQWMRAKSQDTFAPMGPYLVTTEDVPDPQALNLRCWVNGQLRQNASTNLMMFTVAHLISFISNGITLYPGDVISTGTPGGVGNAMKPPVLLQHGDELVMEIERIGRLSNPIKRCA